MGGEADIKGCGRGEACVCATARSSACGGLPGAPLPLRACGRTALLRMTARLLRRLALASASVMGCTRMCAWMHVRVCVWARTSTVAVNKTLRLTSLPQFPPSLPASGRRRDRTSPANCPAALFLPLPLPPSRAHAFVRALPLPLPSPFHHPADPTLPRTTQGFVSCAEPPASSALPSLPHPPFFPAFSLFFSPLRLQSLARPPSPFLPIPPAPLAPLPTPSLPPRRR